MQPRVDVLSVNICTNNKFTRYGRQGRVYTNKEYGRVSIPIFEGMACVRFDHEFSDDQSCMMEQPSHDIETK